MNGYADVIVIGGGIIGLSCAWRLAQNGARVTLVERDVCGSGASGSALGVMAPPSPFKKSFFHTLYRKSLSMCPKFFNELHEASNIELSYNQRGLLEIISSQSQLEQAIKESEMAEKELHGNLPKLAVLKQTESIQKEPFLQHSEFGCLSSPTAAEVSIKSCLSALKKACENAGVQIKEGLVVSKVSIENNLVNGIECNSEKLISAKVLVTAGAWLSQFCSELAMFASVEPVRGQALLFETKKVVLQHIIRWKRQYLVPQSGSLIAFGSSTERNQGYDTCNTVSVLRSQLSDALEILPELADAKIHKVWAGLRPKSIDGKPYLGSVPGVEGLFVAGGHYKIGVGLAPLTAELMAELIESGSNEIDLRSVQPRRDKDFS